MFLIHHFTLKTSLTLSETPASQRAFQEWLPEQCSNYSYLVHGVLALSAFHLAFLRGKESARWVEKAIKHQSRALSGFRAALKSASLSETCDALFAHSIVLVSSAFAASAHSVLFSQNLATSLDDIIAPLIVMRGTGDLSLSMFKAIQAGPFGDLLKSSFEVRGPGALAQSADAQIVGLRKAVCDQYSTSPKELIFSGAIDALHFVYKEIASLGGVKGTPGYVWKWTYLVSQRFIEMLRSRDSVALVIFCYFAVGTAADSVYWYHEGWMERAVLACSTGVNETWKHWLDWPTKQMRQGLNITETPDHALATPSLSPVEADIMAPAQEVDVAEPVVEKA
jgi:hypothetical protein